RTESVPTAVSVAGKGDFLAREQYANTSPDPRISGLRDQAVVQEPGQFGAFLNHYRKSPQPPECVVGPGGVPPHCNSNDLFCPAYTKAAFGIQRQFLELSSRARPPPFND